MGVREIGILVVCAVALLFAGYEVISHLMEVGGYSWQKLYQDTRHAFRRTFGPIRLAEKEPHQRVLNRH